MMLIQDLHIHTTWSTGDSAVVPEQTVQFVSTLKHARIIGISDHLEYLADGAFADYEREVRAAGLRLGVEVDGHEWLNAALETSSDYFVFHCHDRSPDYRSLERMLATGRPVIVAHPDVLDTDLNRVPPECLIEINNRYVWRCDWKRFYTPFCRQFRFVMGSDAHQPNWLNQTVARFVAKELDVEETILFPHLVAE